MFFKFAFLNKMCYDFRMMTEDKKIHWLTRRLKELRKTKADFARVLDANPARIYELENDLWKLQVSHVKKAAEFLEFDRTAFLDFLSGDITEEELWNYKPQTEISSEDLRLLQAVKTIYSRPQAEDQAQDPAQSAALPSKDKGQSR